MSNYLLYFIKCYLFDIGPFKFDISRGKMHQWYKDFRSSDPHVMIVFDHSEELLQLLFIFRWCDDLQGFNLFGEGVEYHLGQSNTLDIQFEFSKVQFVGIDFESHLTKSQ